MPAQFCPFCGTPLGGIDAAFCPQCGRQLPAVTSDATMPATPQPSGPVAPAPPQQPPSYAPPPQPSSGAYAQPAPGAYAAPPAPPYASAPAAPASAPYAAPAGAYAPAPYAIMAPQYMLPTPGGPVTSGRAIGVTAGAAGIALVVSLLTTTPSYRFVAGYIVSVALATLPWVFAGAFWLAIGRLARYSFWQVAGECAVLAFAGLLVLPALDALVVGELLGFGSPANALTWLLPIPLSKYVIILIVTAMVAFGAAGLAWGFAVWPRLRVARVPVSPAASLLLPAGVTAGLFVLTDVLFLLFVYRMPFVFRLEFVFTVIFVMLPAVAIAILGGLLTYNALRKYSAVPAPAPAPVAPPYPAAPPSGAPR